MIGRTPRAWLIWVCALAILCASAAPAAADSKPIGLTVNGRPVKTDLEPVLIDGRVYVPIRAVAEALDARVEWNEATKTVAVRVPKREFFAVIRPDMAQYYSPPNVTLDKNLSVPADPRIWERALREMQYPTDWITFQYMVLVLPYKIRELSGTKCDNAVAVSYPNHSAVVFSQAADHPEGEVMGFAVHEFGHEVWFSLMDAQAVEEYRRLRGITNEREFNEDAEYARRPQEIFAEDFRLLFAGSPAARYPHASRELPAPEDVPGLKEFMLGLVKH